MGGSKAFFRIIWKRIKCVFSTRCHSRGHFVGEKFSWIKRVFSCTSVTWLHRPTGSKVIPPCTIYVKFYTFSDLSFKPTIANLSFLTSYYWRIWIIKSITIWPNSAVGLVSVVEFAEPCINDTVSFKTSRSSKTQATWTGRQQVCPF